MRDGGNIDACVTHDIGASLNIARNVFAGGIYYKAPHRNIMPNGTPRMNSERRARWPFRQVEIVSRIW